MLYPVPVYAMIYNACSDYYYHCWLVELSYSCMNYRGEEHTKGFNSHVKNKKFSRLTLYYTLKFSCFRYISGVT